MKIQNSKGTVFYGLHCYPGVAEYSPPGESPYRVYLNEDTLRSMDASFAGRPVYVMHVEDIPDLVDDVRHEADGWVIESFFNTADGKHWVKFLAVTERAVRAITKHGMKLSNCYLSKGQSRGGVWNGVSYQHQITAAEYEHLAIVPDPRYAESVIFTPEQFKRYNEEKTQEIARVANGKDEPPMAFKFFKRQKVENSVDLNEMMVALPKSKRELTVDAALTAYDDVLANEGKPRVANAIDLVTVGDEEMTVAELTERYENACKKMNKGKKKNEDEEVEEGLEAKGGDADHVLENEDDDGDEDDGEEMMNEEDEEEKEDKKAKEKKENKAKAKGKKKNEADATPPKHRSDAGRDRADRMRNARRDHDTAPLAVAMTTQDQVALGKQRYGS